MNEIDKLKKEVSLILDKIKTLESQEEIPVPTDIAFIDVLKVRHLVIEDCYVAYYEPVIKKIIVNIFDELEAIQHCKLIPVYYEDIKSGDIIYVSERKVTKETELKTGQLRLIESIDSIESCIYCEKGSSINSPKFYEGNLTLWDYHYKLVELE